MNDIISTNMFRKITPYFLFFAVLFPSLTLFAQALAEVSTSTSPEKTSESSRAVLEAKASSVSTYDQLISAIRQVRHASESRVEAAVEQEKVREAWETGKLIDEHILLHKERQEYGKQVIERLGKDLEIGRTELYYMLEFARTYPIVPAQGQLSWAHYKELLSVNDETERKNLEEKTVKEKWSQREVRQEINRRKPVSPSLRGPKGRGNRSDLNEVNSVRGTQSAVLDVKPGKPGIYRIVELKGKKYYDLGFSTYRRLLGGELKSFNMGDFVAIKSSGASYQPTEVSSSKDELYSYNAQVTGVYDGDTFHALIDLGFGTVLEQRLRLRQLDAPEILTGEGKEAKAALEKALMKDGGKVILKVSKSDDQYGRYLVDVFVGGKSIDQQLLDSGVFTVRGQD